jgi:hypothetical protein
MPILAGAPGQACQGDDPVSTSILPEKLFSDSICTIYRGRALVVLSWHAQPTVVGVGPVSHALLATVKGNAADTLICALIDTEMPMPDSATREVLQAGIQRLGVVRGVVNVIAGTGFRAAAMRGMLSGFSMLVRHRYPMSFVATENEAASFLVNQWPAKDAPPPSQSDLARVLGDVKPVYAARKMA